MKAIVVSQAINADRESVWSMITDLDRWGSVISAIENVERLDDGTGFAVGTRWRETRTMFGRTATEEMEVTSVDEGQSYVVEAESNGAHYRSVFTVEQIQDGHTELTMSFGAEPTGLFGKIMGATVGRLFAGATRKAVQTDLSEIAAALDTNG